MALTSLGLLVGLWWLTQPAEALAPSGFALQLPYPHHQSMQANGPHGYVGSSGTRNSVDFGNNSHVDVVAAAAGTVRIEPCPGGSQVWIDHAEGWTTGYRHLSSVTVKSGDSVARGQKIGVTGFTCGANGFNHVHFSVKQHGKDVFIDGLDIGGNTLHAENGHYNGHWTRNSDGVRVAGSVCQNGECGLASGKLVSHPVSDPASQACASSPVDGCLLKTADQLTVYVVAGGAKFAFRTQEDFFKAGYSFDRVAEVPRSVLDRLGSVPKDGTLIRSTQGPTVWVMAGGAKFGFRTQEDFFKAGYSFDRVVVVPEGSQDAFGEVPKDGTLIRSTQGPTVWVMAGGAKFGFRTQEDFFKAGYSFDRVVVVPEGSQDAFGEMPKDGALLREPGLPELWRVREKHRFLDDEADADGAVTVPTGGLDHIPVGESSGPSASTRRLHGASRQETAVAVARHVFPAGAPVVYVAEEGAGLGLALAAGSLNDGPVLLVNRTGSISSAVSEAIAELDPEEVVALGDAEGGVSEQVLEQLAAGRASDRVEGHDLYSAAAQIALRAWPEGAAQVYLAEPHRLVDGVAGGVVTDGPILLVPDSGRLSGVVIDAIRRLNPKTVTALGGPSAVSEDILEQAAQGRRSGRISGASRFETAVAISQRVFRNGAPTVYLTRHDLAPDAVVGGAVTDGPVLLVEPCNGVHDATAAEIRRLRPQRVIALGGPAAVCDETLEAAARESITDA